MGNPTKQAGGNVVFSHHSVTFTGTEDETESTGVIAETPMARSVILNSGFHPRLYEDGTGADNVRGCALRQVNDTNLGLWVTTESGPVAQITLKVSMLTFPASAIKHLVHYVQDVNGEDTNEDWVEIDLTLSQPVTDPAKASVFAAIVGGQEFPRAGEGDGQGHNMSGSIYIDTTDLNKVKFRYQSTGNPDNDMRLYFSVLELK